jgi:hypothetical protein
MIEFRNNAVAESRAYIPNSLGPRMRTQIITPRKFIALDSPRAIVVIIEGLTPFSMAICPISNTFTGFGSRKLRLAPPGNLAPRTLLHQSTVRAVLAENI